MHAAADWQAGKPDRVEVRTSPPGPTPISTDVAERLKGDAVGRLTVELRNELPVGRGFGMSAGGALATALAVARVLRRPRRRAVEVAHLADLFGGGGLGGVASILGGGLEVRRRPGIPPWGEIRRSPFRPTVFLAVVGPPLASPPLLRDGRFLRRVEEAAAEGLARVGERPSPVEFLRAAEAFTDHLRLGPAPVHRRIRAWRGAGIHVAQAVFGRSLFAVATSPGARARLIRAIARSGVPAVETTVISPSETL